ncbi:antirestriction protein ArdA [Streptomyces roseoverticillatus]|uniref:antirestriction protein ArdA n=1 Tax=Streptomyces roseoverticillatus TaxID=66429 RepID=UPI001F42097B|nr:antirestriction protein ArdA [Streptomyces roseoverticillatus]MCF3100988.1 antirestriction protein ArdA [Streptomyces roseoverticillatus]
MSPWVYVASLSDYVSGRLHGEWIAADQSPEDIGAEVTAMLAASPEPHAEEWAIHDHEGFDGIEIHEYDSLETVAALAQLVTQHPAEVVGYLRGEGLEPEDIAEAIDDRFRGVHDSLADYACEWIDDLGDLPEPYRNYRWSIAQAMAHDWEVGGEYVTVRTSEGLAVLANA